MPWERPKKWQKKKQKKKRDGSISLTYEAERWLPEVGRRGVRMGGKRDYKGTPENFGVWIFFNGYAHNLEIDDDFTCVYIC